jgi:phosphinothricin acetyltransferase
VAEDDGGVLGYAYAAPYRTRAGYRYTVEDSIYVDPAAVGRGVGRRLLERLIEACVACGCRQMIAVIGDTDNSASIGMHEACGFARVGMLPSVGFKFGRWVDSVLMQRGLAEADRSPPGAGGAQF